MTFASLPLAAVLAGLAGLAGILFVLQRLRVRHREVPVVTTLFWREAIEESRARVLFQRFRHPLAYLLVLGIVSLLWLALADPRGGGGDREDVVLLVDGSARMARPGRFERAVRAAGEEASRIDPGRRAVILCGAAPVTVLAPGENALLLPRRLEGAAPDACPETLTETIRSLADGSSGDALVIRIFGDSPLDPDRLALLPDSVTVARATAPAPAGANRGITALGVEESASGRWGAVDVLIRAAGPGAEEILGTLDGGPLPAGRTTRRADGAVELRIADVPARGGLLEVALPASDGIPADDVARLRLPDRPPIRVALAGRIPERLSEVIAADPAVRVVEEGPEVPLLSVEPGDPEGHSILLVDPSGREPVEVLSDALRDLALDEIDAFEIAERTGRPVTVGVTPGARREVRLAADLLGEGYDFTDQRAFPVFVGRAVRWLAGADDFPRVVAAGRPVPGRTAARVDAAGRPHEPAGAPFVPPEAGTFSAAGMPDVAASLLDPTLVAPAAATAGPDADGPEEGGPVDARTVLGLLAFALLAVEWWLSRTGRMP